MQISQIVSSYNTSSVKENVKSEISLHKDEKEVSKKQPEISNLSAKEISNSYFLQYQKDITQNASSNLLVQGGLSFNVPENLSDILAGLDLAGIGYNGKAIGELSSDEASELVSENGFFGIANTADRIAGFVLNGAGDDVEKLKAGREGVAKGFEDARKIWGGELPEISQKTIEKISPMEGAKEFLDELREMTQVIILSDTFAEFAKPLMKKLGWPTIFCNSLEVAENGEITGYRMRVEKSKYTTVKALQSIGYDTIASGDSYNDMGMIQASKAGFLFKSPKSIQEQFPQVPAYDTYEELLDAIKAARA